MRVGCGGQTQNLSLAGNARKVEKRLELTPSGDWTTDEARMLPEGVRIRVV